MKDENDQTRRERNASFEHESPELIINDRTAYLWDWFFDLSSGVGRVANGVCSPIPWAEMLAWATATGNIVRPAEYDILRAIDLAYCAEMNLELKDYQDRRIDEGKKKGKKSGR